MTHISLYSNPKGTASGAEHVIELVHQRFYTDDQGHRRPTDIRTALGCWQNRNGEYTVDEDVRSWMDQRGGGRESWTTPRSMTDELTRLIDPDLDAMPPAEEFPRHPY